MLNSELDFFTPRAKTFWEKAGFVLSSTLPAKLKGKLWLNLATQSSFSCTKIKLIAYQQCCQVWKDQAVFLGRNLSYYKKSVLSESQISSSFSICKNLNSAFWDGYLTSQLVPKCAVQRQHVPWAFDELKGLLT